MKPIKVANLSILSRPNLSANVPAGNAIKTCAAPCIPSAIPTLVLLPVITLRYPERTAEPHIPVANIVIKS